MIAEAGWKGRPAISIGGRTSMHRQPRLISPGVTMTADDAASHGAYLLVEQARAGDADQPGSWTAFVRTGVSDGVTTPFGDGVQLGVTGLGIVRGRPDPALSVGAANAGISRAYCRANPPGKPRWCGRKAW